MEKGENPSVSVGTGHGPQPSGTVVTAHGASVTKVVQKEGARSVCVRGGACGWEERTRRVLKDEWELGRGRTGKGRCFVGREAQAEDGQRPSCRNTEGGGEKVREEESRGLGLYLWGGAPWNSKGLEKG